MWGLEKQEALETPNPLHPLSFAANFGASGTRAPLAGPAVLHQGPWASSSSTHGLWEMKQSWGWSWARTSLQPLSAVLANPEQALATGLPHSCPTPAIARPVFCTLSLHKVFALLNPMQILSLSPLPGLCRSQPSLFSLLLSLIAEFLLPAALRVQLRSGSSKSISRPVPWSWEGADETVGTPSSY